MFKIQLSVMTACLACGAASAQWSLVQTIRPPAGGEADSEFGRELAMHVDRVAISQWGAEADGWETGRVYVYARSPGDWTGEQVIQRDDVSISALFGDEIALGGDVLLVSAPWHDVPRDRAGVVYCYRWNGFSWEPTQEIVPASGPRYEQTFGSGLSLDGRRLLVGAVWDRMYAPKQGAAFIFENDGTEFTQVARLEAGDGEAEDFFGAVVALSGDVAAVSATREAGPDGHVGAVYMFEFDGVSWVESAKLTQTDNGWGSDDFGDAIALDGDTLVVGGPQWTPDACTCITCGCAWGRVYVYEREDFGDWRLVQTLVPDDAVAWATFGSAVALQGDRLVIGARRDERPDEYAGAAYLFERQQNGLWEQTQRLSAEAPRAWDHFGTAVGVNGSAVVVTATEAFFDADRNGAAYRFEPECSADWNNDGLVDSRDVLAFLNDWAAGDPEADINGDGTVNSLDVLAFLNAWAAGCG